MRTSYPAATLRRGYPATADGALGAARCGATRRRCRRWSVLLSSGCASLASAALAACRR